MILRDARSGVWPRRKVKVMSVEIKREGDPTPQSLRAEMTVLMCGDLEVAEGAGHRVRCHQSGPLAGFGAVPIGSRGSYVLYSEAVSEDTAGVSCLWDSVRCQEMGGVA